MNPKVSIIIPAYNCENYISKCIESILSQTYPNFELIIINDGSYDNTEIIIKEYCQLDKRIKYYSQVNQGPSAARNIGLKKASGDYIAFIDSDDTVEKKYLESLVINISKTSADLICCGYVEISKFGENKHIDFSSEKLIAKNEFLNMVCQGTGGVLWSKLFKRDIINEYNILLDTKVFMCEDLLFVLMYAEKCNSFTAIKEYSYNYNRLNEKSISANISLSYLENYIIVWKKVKEILNAMLNKEKDIQEIVRKKVQATAISMIEQQSSIVNQVGFKKVYENISNLLKNNYLMMHKSNFKSSNILEIPLVYFIKKDLIVMCIVYVSQITKLKRIKFRYRRLVTNYE